MKNPFNLFAFIFLMNNHSLFSQECDKILLKDGTEISVTVEELRLNEIAYHKCGNSAGPLYVIEKEKVFLIRYKNGTKEVIQQKDIQQSTSEITPSMERNPRMLFGLDLIYAIGKDINKMNDNIIFTDASGNIVKSFDRQIKYSYGISAFLDFSVSKNSYLGINAGIEHFPKSLGLLEYSKIYFPVLVEYKFQHLENENGIGFSLALGYSLTNTDVKYGYFPEPVPNPNFGNPVVTIEGIEAVVNNNGLGSGLIINPKLTYLRKIRNALISITLGYRLQSYRISWVGKYQYIPDQGGMGIQQAIQLSLGFSGIEKFKN